jgi:hypothetical protein
MGAWAEPHVPQLDPFHEAARSGRIGQVVGRAYEEPRTPAGPDQPLAGVEVALVPFSEALQEEMDRVKEQARSSMAAYRGAVPRIQQVLEAYVKALREAGATDLLVAGVADAQGTFRFEKVPAGRWMLVARHSHPGRQVSVSRRQPIHASRTFVLSPAVTGHSVVRVWRGVLELGNEPATVALTDRNVWYTGVLEETAPR